MTAKETTTATRLAGLREVIRAANGDWHEATALWSVQNDVQWLLDNFAAPAAPAAPDNLDYESEWYRKGWMAGLAAAVEVVDALPRWDAGHHTEDTVGMTECNWDMLSHRLARLANPEKP